MAAPPPHLPNDGSFLERFQRGEIPVDPELLAQQQQQQEQQQQQQQVPVIDPHHPMLLEACKLLSESTEQLTEEQKQYYLQYLHFYGYPFDPNNPFQHLQAAVPPQFYQQQQQQHHQQHFAAPVRQEDPPSTIVWLGNLSPDTIEDDILRLANSVSRVSSLKLIAHKGIAFVHFATIDDARIVYDKFQGAVIKGSPIRVGWGRQAADAGGAGGGGGGGGGGARSNLPPQHDDVPPSNNLWVGNVPPDVSPEIIHQIFSRCGDVTRVRILQQKNCAFVTFRTVEEATRARAELHGFMMGSTQLRINFGRPDVARVDDAGNERSARFAFAGTGLVATAQPVPPMTPVDPPRDEVARVLIDKIAAKVGASNTGDAFLELIRERHANDPRFGFLKPSDAHHSYYAWMVFKAKDPAGAERAVERHQEILAQLSRPPAPTPAAPPVSDQPRQSRFGVGPTPQQLQLQQQQQQQQTTFNNVAPPMQLQQGVIQVAPPRHASGLFVADAEQLGEIVAQLEPTKESIRDAKDWIMMRAPGGVHIADYLAHYAMPAAPTPEARQNLVFLVNDVLHHCMHARPVPVVVDELALMFYSSLGDLLRIPFMQSADEAQSVLQIIGIWRDKQIYTAEQIRFLEMQIHAPPPPPPQQQLLQHQQVPPPPPPLQQQVSDMAGGFLDRLAGEMQQHHQMGKRSLPDEFGDEQFHAASRTRLGYE